MRDSIMLYRSQCDALRNLPPEQFMAAVTAIWDYGMDDKEPEGDPVAIAMVGMAKPLIDKNNRNYENGKRGGRKPNQTEANDNRDETEPKATNNRTETEHEPSCNLKEKGERLKVKEITSKDVTKKRFTPPTVDEVQQYIAEQGYTVDANKFVDFYTAKGWLVGKSPMKDWKAAVRNWSRSKPQEKKSNRFTVMSQRDFDWDDFGRTMDGV